MRPVAAMLLAASLLCTPWTRTGHAGAQPARPTARPKAACLYAGSLDEMDNVQLLPASKGGPPRLVLGDTHGLLHVYEQRGDAYAEVWTSGYLEGAVSGVFVVDVNDDELTEVVVFTEQGRIHYFDTEAYNPLWSNPPGEYDRITAHTVCNIDDDPQPELLFCAAGRLVIYDGREHYEEWRSDQTNLRATDVLVADVDGDGEREIVLNVGYVFDARFRNLEWQSPDSFGERMGALDVDDDGILEVVGEFNGRFLRVFDIDLRREKSLPPTY